MPRTPQTPHIAFTILYNNIALEPGLTTDWGMSCLVELPDRAILFDTGGDGDVLLCNMMRLGKNPGQVATVVLSHEHQDHVGGLSKFLKRNPAVQVVMPASFSNARRKRVGRTGASVLTVDKPIWLTNDVFVTGPLANGIDEQALGILTARGLVVITGCAHPGIVRIVEKAAQVAREPVALVFGGFHLRETSKAGIEHVIRELKRLGVRGVGPSHCTGTQAIKLFRDAWGAGFVELGCGGKLALPARPVAANREE